MWKCKNVRCINTIPMGSRWQVDKILKENTFRKVFLGTQQEYQMHYLSKK